MGKYVFNQILQWLNDKHISTENIRNKDTFYVLYDNLPIEFTNSKNGETFKNIPKIGDKYTKY